MTALINQDHLMRGEVAAFLRKSQCGLWKGEQKVCCDVSSVDFGDRPPSEFSTKPPTMTTHTPYVTTRTDAHKKAACGKLNSLSETPLKWIGELWFHTDAEQTLLESKCLGVLITFKHLVVPAHCVVALPEHISL